MREAASRGARFSGKGRSLSGGGSGACESDQRGEVVLRGARSELRGEAASRGAQFSGKRDRFPAVEAACAKRSARGSWYCAVHEVNCAGGGIAVCEASCAGKRHRAARGSLEREDRFPAVEAACAKRSARRSCIARREANCAGKRHRAARGVLEREDRFPTGGSGACESDQRGEAAARARDSLERGAHFPAAEAALFLADGR